MTSPLCRTLGLFGLGVSLCLLTALRAQDSPTPTSQPPLPATARAPAPPIPVPPPLRSPVDSFRELLAMKPAERDHFLANRPPEVRKRIIQKIGEYESLNPEERELRLQMTQLRWYLLRFMQTPATNYVQLMLQVPAKDRRMIQDHLKPWYRLSPEQQQEVLKYLPMYGNTNSPPSTPDVNKSNQPEDWATLSPDQRQQMSQRFQQFFELTDDERQRTLHTLSDAERAQMEKALKLFGNLPQDRRERCLRAFPRLARMSDADRADFLQSAERWKDLPPSERQAWRNLVTRLPAPPPLPPPLPPSAPVHMQTRTTALADTNGSR